MPITAYAQSIFMPPTGPHITAARWRYVPGEQMDVSGFAWIRTLYISAYHPRDYSASLLDVDVVPYTIPSLTSRFPNLTQVYITNWDYPNLNCFIGNLTDVPTTVREISLGHTYISNLGVILSGCPNLFSLHVDHNLCPITMSCPLPETLTIFNMYKSVVDDAIIFPTTVLSITIGCSRFPRIYGLDQFTQASVWATFYECESPYGRSILNSSSISHINRVNAELIYQDFASIPEPRDLIVTRCGSDEETWKRYWQNPINRALHLTSNYPRRIAEFVANELVVVHPVIAEELPHNLEEDNYADNGMGGEYDY